MFRTALLCSLSAFLLAACPSKKTAPKERATEPQVEQVEQVEGVSAAAANPKLVLVLVLDQVPSSAILRSAPSLAKEGVIRRAIEGGMFHERVRYGFAGTNTAPGHASIFTGELPADHGVDTNDIHDYQTNSRIRIVDDGKHQMFGVEGKFASPSRLLKPTIGDLLKDKNPASKVVSLSMKGRAAVISGGKKADFVGWYDSHVPGFTTSSYYAESTPAWIDAWNAENPLEDRLGTWTAGDPELYKKLDGADDAAGEADWYGLGSVFHHEPSNTLKPSKTFVATPSATDYLHDMTRTAVKEFGLGQDEAPDLLMVSVSTTDYAGHTFGSDSWEYLDVLAKADKALGTLVDELSASTDLAVVITSDHGGTPLAEISIAKGEPGGRVFADVLIAKLEAIAAVSYTHLTLPTITE